MDLNSIKCKWTMLMFHPINNNLFTLHYCGPFSKAHSELRSLQSAFDITVKLMVADSCLAEAKGNQFENLWYALENGWQ